MSDWITDRLPTDDDADREGTVERTDFLNVMPRQAWMPIDEPPPYQPPPLEPCDHEWEAIDESFDHEYGCEQIVIERCKLCDEERDHNPPTFEDDVR